MAFKIVLLAGDGVGPEVMREGVKVLKAVESAYGVSFDLVPFPCGGQHYLETGEEWPDGAFESCKAADAILLGAVGLLVALRRRGVFDLYLAWWFGASLVTFSPAKIT